jgi:outer membrane protein assembly factor BamB
MEDKRMKKCTTYCVLGLLIFSLFGCKKPKPVVDKPVEKRIRSTNPVQIPNVKLIWKYKLAETSNVCDPVVNKNLIYTINGNNLVAVDISNGKEIWKKQTSSIEGSYPSISNNILIFGSYDTYVYALNAATGDLIWKFKTNGEVHSKACIENGVVFIGSDDGRLYALELATGKQIWNQRLGERIYNEPLVNEGTIFISVRFHEFYSIDASTGKINWAKEIDDRYHHSNKKPVIVGRSVIYGSLNGYCYAFDRMNGKLQWKYEAFIPNSEGKIISISAEPVVYQKSIIIFSDGSIHALDSANGKLLWKIEINRPLDTDPMIWGDTLYLGGNDGRLYAFDLIDRSIKLVFDDYRVNDPLRKENKEIRTDKPLVVGSTIYFRTWGTYLYAIKLPEEP